MYARKFLREVTGLLKGTETLAKIFFVPFLQAMILITFGCCLITLDASNALWTRQSFETQSTVNSVDKNPV